MDDPDILTNRVEKEVDTPFGKVRYVIHVIYIYMYVQIDDID